MGDDLKDILYHHETRTGESYPELVFLNVYGAQGIDSKEWIPPAYVAWRAGTITLFLLGS